MITPILIEDPKGLDLIIQEFQVYLQNNLTEIESIFGRCFKTETKDGFIPEVYIGKNEYFDIFSTDKINSHLFFDVDDFFTIEKFDKTANIRLIVSADLSKIYNYNHRADENLIIKIEEHIRSFIDKSKYATWTYNNLIKKTNNVFSNYSYKLSDNLVDMQPYFVCAFEFKTTYSNAIIC